VGEPLRTLRTPDGRTLAYATWGDPDGFPILGLHGTPGCRFNRWPNEDVYRKAGVCYVTHDRAGYGRSDRRRGRSVADEWLAANVPGCIVEIETSAGYLGADPEKQIASDARWLSEGIPPEGARAQSPAL
jgi:pimeloyl-ACP methyl ester carboxylesterase